MTSDYLYWNPWARRWLPPDEHLAAIDEQIALSKTWRYRFGRARERLLHRPVRPNAAYLQLKKTFVCD